MTRESDVTSRRAIAGRRVRAGAVVGTGATRRRVTLLLHAVGWLVAGAVPSLGQAQAGDPRASTSAIVGTVHDSSGFAVRDAIILVQGSRRQTRSAADGRFRLDGVPVGAAVVTVQRLGFYPDTIPVQLSAGAPAMLDVRLRPLAQRLDAVTVQQGRQVSDARLEGYRTRLEAGRAGYFITKEQLAQTTSWSLPDLLRRLPGVRVSRINGLAKAVRLRGSLCPPLVFVDGFPASAGEFDLDILDVKLLEGVEVYPSMVTVPPEFGAARSLERCGVIAVWTSPAPGRRRAAAKAVDVDALVSEGDVFTANQVQQVARLDTAASIAASYPDSLWRAGVSGRVLLELVVNADGTVEPGTVRVISATRAEFGESARQALESSFFQPAVLVGRAVRQLVQMPVVFSPQEAVPPAGGAPPPPRPGAPPPPETLPASGPLGPLPPRL